MPRKHSTSFVGSVFIIGREVIGANNWWYKECGHHSLKAMTIRLMYQKALII
jgi:hypothetical protein